MGEPQLQLSTPLTLPLGPLPMVQTIDSTSTTTLITIYTVAGNVEAMIGDAAGANLTSSRASLDLNTGALQAVFNLPTTVLTLTGTFISNTKGSGSYVMSNGPVNATWTAEAAMQLPILNVPFYISYFKVWMQVGLLSIDSSLNLSFTASGSQTPVALGSLSGYLNADTGALASFQFSTPLVISDGTNQASCVSISGSFQSNITGNGNLVTSTGGTLGWQVEPTLALPTPLLPFSIDNNPQGQIYIDTAKNLWWTPDGTLPGTNAGSLTGSLSSKSGQLSRATINLTIGVTTYTWIAGNFSSGSHGGGTIGNNSPKRQDDTWLADVPNK